MDYALPGGTEASYRLLGLQVIAHDGGVILKRGTTRVFLTGDGVAELVDLLVERLAGGRSVAMSQVTAEVGSARRDALLEVIETLKAHRFLTTAETNEDPSRRHEDVFFWNYQTSFAEIVGELADVPLTVFGVNTIGLALLGNLRGCGFADITFVDHPALRNVGYFDSTRQLRPAISGALSVPPEPLEDWSTANPNPGGCLVVCCDFGGRPLMREWNRFAVDRNVFFYPIVLLDHVAQIGPLVRPGAGPCYECLWARQDANMADAARERAGEAEPDSGQLAIGYLQPMARVAADFAAVDLLKTFSRSLSTGPVSRMIEIDLLEPGLAGRDVLRAPRCPVCSQMGQPAAAAVPEGAASAPVPVEADAGSAAGKESESGEAETDPITAAEETA